MNLIQRFGKKKVMIVVGVALLVLTGIGTGVWYTNEQNKKQKVLDSIDIVFKEDAMIEYGQEKVNFNDFIKEKKGEPKITLPTDKINTKKLEKKEIVYTLSKDGYSKAKNLTIIVKDTKAPEIVFKEESLTLEHGTAIDIKTNINSVKDIVDGDIPFEEKAKESNYYVIEGTVDTSITGDYKIKVIAVDKNGLKTEKEYSVHVNEENQQSNEASVYDPNTGTFVKEPTGNNGGGNNGGNTGNTGVNGGNGGGETGGGNTPVQPNGIGAVINTAYSFVGGNMSCNDLVIQSYTSNGYSIPSGSAYYLGYSIGTNVDNIIAGDVIVLSGHVMLVVSKSGTNITVVEGGVNGNNVEVTNCVGQGNLFYHNGVAERKVIDIRRY